MRLALVLSRLVHFRRQSVLMVDICTIFTVSICRGHINCWGSAIVKSIGTFIAVFYSVMPRPLIV